MMNKDRLNPWAGLASYEDPEIAERKLKFCGRDDDSYDVAKLIMGNIFVTLYGKSGIGKTSLLNAGVFPELREEQYTPISLRLGMRDETHPQSYQSVIIEAIERTVQRADVVNVIDEQTDLQAIDFLWNYFARHRFSDKHEGPTTPVIVFDQFEEVFRTNRKEAEILLRQLDYINDKDHTLDNCEVDGNTYRYEQNFRFVVSIREDDLYRLEDSIDNCYLPALKRCRYRLRSLSEDGARDAILIPGAGLFKEEEQEAIVNTIINIARNDEDHSISTNLLSLVCNRIFVDFQKSDADYISLSLVETFVKGNPFERFYNEATRGFSNREKSYIEDHLVDSTGRRNSIPESDFLMHVKDGAMLLEGSRKILQRTSTSSDGSNYRVELIHDSFCEPLAGLKEKRERRKRIKWFAYSTIAFILLLCILGAITYLYYNKVTQERTIEEQKRENALLTIRNNELELKLKDNTSLEENADLDMTYISDGITYKRYGLSKKEDLDDWKLLNEEICRKKIPQLLKGSLNVIQIPDEMKKYDPGLVYLILKSESIKDVKEKQSWFDLWLLMNEEQIMKLYDILTRERYKLAVLRSRDDAKMLNEEAYDYARLGDYEAAINTIDKSIEMSRLAYANKYDSKGEILLMKGETQQAVEMWKKVKIIADDFYDHHKNSKLYQKLKSLGLIPDTD